MNPLELNKDFENQPEEKELNQERVLEDTNEKSDLQHEQQDELKDLSADNDQQSQVPESVTIETESLTKSSDEDAIAEKQKETIVEEVSGHDDAAEIEASADVEPAPVAATPIVIKASEEKENQSVQKEKVDFAAFERSQLLKTLKSILEQDFETIKEDVEQIKLSFYKKLKQETEEQKKKFIEEGGDEFDFKPAKDELEEELRILLQEFKIKKTAFTARVEQEKENNLIQKQHILEQMKKLTETTDDVSSHINEFKELQQKWKTIGSIPATKSSELWKQYNLYQERFWDLVKINNELREYAFKKNLVVKTELCEFAEKLLEEQDVSIAIRKLQKLHDDWREVGPVARDIREVIWARFKEATSQINKKHQAYFDELRKGEELNLESKIAICDKIENFDISELKTYGAWDKATQEIIDFQKEFSELGYAPRKQNQKVFTRYRKACDTFFAAKTNFYREAKAELAENLQKKRALIEQAELLKDSKEWKETTDKFIKIQKEWKEIGVVQKKYSDEIWKRFIAACDHFFEERNKNMSSQRSEEHENLKKKQAIIERINALESSQKSTEAYEKLKELIEEFRAVGHVPFKEKDKIYKAYREAIDKQFESLNIDVSNRKLDSFRTNLEDMSTKGDNKLYRERERLLRIYENLKSEIATCENNIGFFTSSSKKPNALLTELERKIEALKIEGDLIRKKIDLIEDKLSS